MENFDNNIDPKRIELANLIFGDNLKEPKFYEEKYQIRELKEGARVTRFAPSPTGFVHMGGIYAAYISKMLAKKSEGTFFLRIEDTDQERSIENGITEILNGLSKYDLNPDEGPISETEESGNYGPYIQSKRKEIYHSYAKDMLIRGLAYPCFATKEDNEEIRNKQMKAKLRPGIYGAWSKYREMPVEMAIEEIKSGKPFVIRYKSNGDFTKKMVIKDLIKGKIELPQDDQDIVIIKGDKLPTYHFAHVIDDHLMGTNLVSRGDEWLPSLPLHIGLFARLGFKVPKYAHFSPLLKLDNGNRRKLSKRKDPEANSSYMVEEGIPIPAVVDYLLNIGNSNYEAWRIQNPKKDSYEFDFQLSKMNVAGALFDMVKLLDVSKNHISNLTNKEVYDEVTKWAKNYDSDFYNLLTRNPEYSKAVFGIERDENRTKKRKDLAKWSEAKEQNIYMFESEFENLIGYDNLFIINGFKEENSGKTEALNLAKIIVKDYVENYLDLNDEKDTWFNKIKEIAPKYNFSSEVKEYKNNPENFKGHVGDISSLLRVVFTKRNQTPDLYEILKVLGKENIQNRVRLFENYNG